MYYVGIDVGGTGLKAGVVNEEGKIISKVSCPTLVERGAEPVVNALANLALKAIEEAGLKLDDVKAVGIGIPGILDPRTKRVPICTNLGWHDVPLIELMQKYIDKPVFVDNDATVAALASASVEQPGNADTQSSPYSRAKYKNGNRSPKTSSLRSAWSTRARISSSSSAISAL